MSGKTKYTPIQLMVRVDAAFPRWRGNNCSTHQFRKLHDLIDTIATLAAQKQDNPMRLKQKLAKCIKTLSIHHLRLTEQCRDITGLHS